MYKSKQSNRKTSRKYGKKCADSNTKDSVAMIIADQKMKFEPISARETTLDHYVKRGMSWHRFCVQLYLSENREDESSNNPKVPTLYTICIDQVMSDGEE